MKSVVDLTQKIKDYFQPQVESLGETLTNEVTTRATLGAHNLLVTTDEGFRRYNTAGTWSGDTYVLNGVTFTLNKDENSRIVSIKVNGTASANTFFIYPPFGTMNLESGNYKINGNPSNYSSNTARLQVVTSYNGGVADIGTDYSLSYDGTSAWNNYRLSIRVDSGKAPSNMLFTPMLRLAVDTDTTFAPYAKPNTELTKDDNGLTANAFANGAVNLLENKASNGTTGNVAFQVNSDGTVLANQTGTVSSIYFKLHEYSNDEYQKLFAGKTVKISGTPPSSLGDFWIYAELAGTSVIHEINNPIATLPTTSGTFIVFIRIPAGKTVSNVTFKPMITLADMPNSDYNHYVPYAMSNKELTDAIASKAGTFSASSMVSTSAIEFRQFGKVVAVNGYLTLNGNQTADGATSNELGTVSEIDLPNTNRAVRSLCGIAANPWDFPTEVGYITLTTAGSLQLKTHASGTQNVYFSFSYVVA